ncbi:MAG: hypothetical protein JSV63_00790 [Candidatus Aenigmatarchaeota archaeon]|nr:MAG: hypothetical protein JSV63_00790 [Candidatus Aenigmarchaeota archaeon]
MFGLWGLGIGILSIIFGIFMVFFFPGSIKTQEEELQMGGVFLGVIALIVGGVLIFF